MAEITATEYVCDGCGRSDIRPVDAEPPNGFHGTVRQITDGGGSAEAIWWACKQACIKLAIRRSLDEAWT